MILPTANLYKKRRWLTFGTILRFRIHGPCEVWALFGASGLRQCTKVESVELKWWWVNSKSVSAWYWKKGVEAEIRGCVSETWARRLNSQSCLDTAVLSSGMGAAGHIRYVRWRSPEQIWRDIKPHRTTKSKFRVFFSKHEMCSWDYWLKSRCWYFSQSSWPSRGFFGVFFFCFSAKKFLNSNFLIENLEHILLFSPLAVVSPHLVILRAALVLLQTLSYMQNFPQSQSWQEAASVCSSSFPPSFFPFIFTLSFPAPSFLPEFHPSFFPFI